MTNQEKIPEIELDIQYNKSIINNYSSNREEINSSSAELEYLQKKLERLIENANQATKDNANKKATK